MPWIISFPHLNFPFFQGWIKDINETQDVRRVVLNDFCFFVWLPSNIYSLASSQGLIFDKQNVS